MKHKYIIITVWAAFLSSCSSVNSDWTELMDRAEKNRIEEYKAKNQNDKSFDVKIWKIEF